MDGKDYWHAIVEDITERKQHEQDLRESERKHRTVLEANPDPVVFYDNEGRVIYFNPAFSRVFGWTLSERVGKKMDLFVPDDTWPETRMMIQKVVAGEGFTGLETKRFNKQGEIIPVGISGAVYQDHHGNMVGSVITLRDIRDQKRLEVQFHRSQKMESVGTLAGGIAHDFNNLLMGIQGRTSLMLENLGYRVMIARSGQEAIDLYRENHNSIHIVILDMIMPVIGGGETYEKLKEIDEDVKALLSSGYSMDDHAVEILDRGCNGFMQKPFNMKKLSQKIREILES